MTSQSGLISDNALPMDATTYWQAVLERDKRQNGLFVFAVTTTGIYCLPSCPAKRPKRENVEFFPLPELAEQAGYRPCKRCKPDRAVATDPQVERVRDVCRHIEANLNEPLTLAALGRHFSVSPQHLQRTFKEVVGVTPQEYTDMCRMNSVREALKQGEDISGAGYDAGYGSSSRLYSKAATQLGMTPRAYKRGGEQTHIRYTTAPCSLGVLLVAATERGICAVTLGDDAGQLEEALHSEFDRAELARDDSELAAWVGAILEHLDGRLPNLDLPLDVRATAFQKQVWRELQRIPYGETRSYGEVAKSLGKPNATRAVARACASNPTALVVPCHRVIRGDGGLSGYRWGVKRKETLLEQERTRRDSER